MTNQEMFDIVSHHLLTQNERSYANGLCHYRGSNGLKCAIGCLIPDSLYSPDMENLSVHVLIDKFPFLQQYISNWKLAIDLQTIHDDAPPDHWAARLASTAKDWHLTFTYNATLAS